MGDDPQFDFYMALIQATGGMEAAMERLPKGLMITFKADGTAVYEPHPQLFYANGTWVCLPVDAFKSPM